MAEDEYSKKLESLQQYIPFLNNMIAQLKDPRKKNREQQLTKMVSLHSMITDKKKKLKLETLIKCEDVILKLYDKVKSGANPQLAVDKPTPITSTPLSPFTPSSPSPPRDILKTVPVVIPTEKIPERDGPSGSSSSMNLSTNPFKAKIDVYSSAGASLKLPLSPIKASVFDRLGERAPDMSKPPISLEDLEALQEEDNVVERLSLHELTDLREKLQRQLKTSDRQSRGPLINTTVRNSTILTKKAVDKATAPLESKKVDPKISVKPFTINKPVKVIKEAASIFGSTLSSIDNQILGSKNRRSSTGARKESLESDLTDKKKDRRSSKDDKKSESSHRSSKEKTETKSEHRSKDRCKEDKKASSSSSSKDSKKEYRSKHGDVKHDKNRKDDKEEKINDTTSSCGSTKEETTAKEDKTKTEAPVYKRLADKYNPKPRKPNPDSQTTEAPKKEEVATIPFLEKSPAKSPQTQPLPQLPPLNFPLLSPTSSTNSGDNDIKRSPLLQTPTNHPAPIMGIPHTIPPHVTNILSNPNTTNLVNAVVSQFKARPLMPPNAAGFPPHYNPPPNPVNFNFQGPRFWGNQVPQNFPPPRQEYFPPVHAPRPPSLMVPNFDAQQRFRAGDGNEQPWRRFSWTKDNRNPRGMQRNFREDPRTAPARRESRELEREPRARTRDPRLNRYNAEQEEASRSRETDDGNTFASPLDSLYSNSEGYRVTGKGYGVQNFKIPKIKKDEEVEEAPESEVKATEEPESKTDEIVASTNVSSSSECEKDQHVKPETESSAQESAEITSTNDLQTAPTGEETPAAAGDPQSTMLNKILKTILENKDNPKLSDELRKVVLDNVKTTDGEEEEQSKRPLERRRLHKAQYRAKLLAKQKELRRKMLLKKKQKGKAANKAPKRTETTTEETTSKNGDQEDEEDVIVSVGERIKSRKRAAAMNSPKKRRGKRGELDLLHEDIQDMFIRDGVLTATGKRLCRSEKSSESKSPTIAETRATRRSKTLLEKIEVPVSPDKLKAMSNVRVLIPKISVEKLEVDEDGQRYSLRRVTKSNKSYAEEESDEEKDKDEVEDEESDDVDVESEPEGTVEKPLVETPKKVKKRTNSWASGIIPKRKKKEASSVVEEDKSESSVDEKEEKEEKEEPAVEEKEKSFEFVEPDKNYFSSKPWHFKTPCKLCDFNGKNITQHYRRKHHESETLSSRLSPEKAEQAIKESMELNLDEIEDRVLSTTQQYPFKCRFCDLEMHSKPANFYDHITTHTGEYRHLCTLCSFSACNVKPIRSHYLKVHARDRNNKVPMIKTRVYGYICLECNFVQINKKAVENHVNIYHLGEGKKICKIHLSSTDYKWEKRKKKAEEVSTVEEVAEEPKKSDDEETPKGEEVSAPKKLKLEETVIKKEKEIDMTVFTCNTNIHEENEKIEQERLKTMTELNESVKTNRQSLNFVDQLSNRLLQEQAVEPTEAVTIKNEPVDVDFAEPVLEKPLPLKVMDSPATPSTNSTTVLKDNVNIENVIQKLRGILKEEHQQEPTSPPSASLVDDDKTILCAGFLNVVHAGDEIEYVCRVPECEFSTKSRDGFLAHCNDDHARINSSYKCTKCRVCHAEVAATEEGSFLNNFFAHVEAEHLGRKPLRMRRLSGDKLSASKDETVADDKPDDEEEENPFPFKIAGVMSLAEEELPPLSPIKDKTPKVESVILRESKLTDIDRAIVWKSPEAFRKFVQSPHDLYKCPVFSCKYCTDYRHLFDSHIKAHSRYKDEMLRCVYCPYKTLLSHAGLHIDLRHFSSRYSCSVCLYRALLMEYVVIHMKQNHKDSDLIIILPPKCAKSLVTNKSKMISVREACPAYACGHKDCGLEFLFQDEFVRHVERQHSGVMLCKQAGCTYRCIVPDNMIDHWRSHNCYSFHCLMCKSFGCAELYTMLDHYALTHPNNSPTVVDRRSAPKDSGWWFYTEEAIGEIKYLKGELFDSVNKQKYRLKTWPDIYMMRTSASSSSPGALVQVSPVQVSFLQENTDKKIIAIIPKTMPPQAAAPSFVLATIDKNKEETATDKGPVEDTQAAAGADPLSIDHDSSFGVADSEHESDALELADKSFGLVGYQLYRCVFCDISFSNSRDFKTHCTNSLQCRDAKNPTKPFKCVHCERAFKHSHGLVEHVQYHGPLRFGCSLCVKKFPSSFSLKVHMRNKHSVTHTITTPVVPNKTNMDRDEFVLRPITEPLKEDMKSPGTKSSYGPEEVDQIPKRYIFNSNIKCALCPYSNKVRANLVRHLQFHSAEKSVPEIAPVNPVPCLDKNEKMFDKMTNLAISSFTSGGRMGGPKIEPKVERDSAEVPAYVPLNRRYVCCAPGCNYLCLEEANLRHHLFALHAQETAFTCAHCKATLVTEVEAFLKHLKLHDMHLYKCSNCSFVHNLRHKVNKHAADKHPDKGAQTITVRSMEAEVLENAEQSSCGCGADTATPLPTNVKWTKPWHCGMCKYRCAAKADIITHINKHDINTQYKCTLCTYKTDEMNTFEGHFKENHPDNTIDFIHVYYKSDQNGTAGQSEKQFDTTPLWQRDRPRVRHIRGILFEESGRGDKICKKIEPKKIVATSTPSTSASNLDLAIEAVATGASNLDLAIEAVATGVDFSALAVKAENEKEIIFIDDEDADSLDAPDMVIDIDALEEEPKVKVELDMTNLSEEKLFETYGNAVLPNCVKAFKCPKCVKFKFKKVSVFVEHLLIELKCNRFKCNACDYVCVLYESMTMHCQENHDGVIDGNVTEIGIDPSVIYWMQLLVKQQAKSQTREYVPPGQETLSSTFKTQCEYCRQWFRNIQLREHHLLHWAEHTYSCGHCGSEHATMNALFEHNTHLHPGLENSVKVNGPSVESIINSMKSGNKEAAGSSATGEHVQFACMLCKEVVKSLELLKKHFAENHQGDDKFAYRVVAKPKVDIYACKYCHARGTEKFLAKHHDEQHKNLKFDVYQFICLECSSTFANNKDIRGHFTKDHAGKKLSYSCVERKASGTIEQYCCTTCPFRSCSVGGIRSHLRKHMKPIDCKTCGGVFVYPTEAREHHKKEHPDKTEAFEENQARLARYEELVKEIVTARDKGFQPAPPQRKMLARKSTGTPFVRKKPDLRNLTTSIE